MFNVPMRELLGLPVATPLSKRLMLVHHTGRKTGKHYRQPVSYVDDHGTLLTPGGGRWTRNLRGGESVRVRLRGRDVTAYPELVADPDEIERLLAVMAKANPSLRRFVPIPRDAEGRLERASLAAAIEHGFRVVRWHLDSSAPIEGGS
jgi:deazaflavin-dependent oxidoreductase (nitroreductase family)